MNNLKAVVVYVDRDTVRAIDARVRIRQFLAASDKEAREITRSSVVREALAEMAAATPPAIDRLVEEVRACQS